MEKSMNDFLRLDKKIDNTDNEELYSIGLMIWDLNIILMMKFYLRIKVTNFKRRQNCVGKWFR